MKNWLLLFYFLPILCGAQGFVANKGQWEGNFLFKNAFANGEVWIESNGFTLGLMSGEERKGHAHASTEHISTYFLRMRWMGGQSNNVSGSLPLSGKRNYFLGNNPDQWVTGIHGYGQLLQEELYPGVDVVFEEHPGGFKYTYQLEDPSKAAQITQRWEGATPKLKEGKLQLQTPLGELYEYIPKAFQKINGKEVAVNCIYTIRDDAVSLQLHGAKKGVPVTIDPILVFSSFSGSVANNFGFTATYDQQGNLYGGGISFGLGYPTTIGVVQANFGGGTIDCGISIFSSDGTTLLYSTYLGGSGPDQPHSLVTDAFGNLYIFGVTGSTNFPTTPGAFQTTYNGGTATNQFYFSSSDIFIAKLSPTGNQLLGCTYLGGDQNDGVGAGLESSYADKFRGEIILNNDRVYVASCTQSATFPATFAAGQSSAQGLLDGVAFCMNSSLTGLFWATYIGGTDADVAYSLAFAGSNLYVGGTTRGGLNNFPGGGATSSPPGAEDGYILRLDVNTGSWNAGTYIGSAAEEFAYLLATDKNNQVYVTGTTYGGVPVTAGKWTHPATTTGLAYGNFIQSYNPDLNSLNWSTAFSSIGATPPNITPTAFMVDECLNIYLSGWGGEVNSQGYTFDLPTTSDAFQSTTDGSDFYFLVLGPYGANLQFASFFGGQPGDDHVDGGTSRFSPDGVIYQAVCAACSNGTFPTTPGAYGIQDSADCNLGVMKISFEQIVLADASIDIQTNVDTTCNSLEVTFSNTSIHADIYTWDFGNGDTSSLFQPTTTYNQTGTYVVTLVATDTICGRSDTLTINLVHDQPELPVAEFYTNYRSCNAELEVEFMDSSFHAHRYYWDFGDGATSNAPNPTHSYPNFGQYLVWLVVEDTICGFTDSTSSLVVFEDTIALFPTLSVAADACSNGKVLFSWSNLSSHYLLNWTFGDGQLLNGSTDSHQYLNSGTYTVQVVVEDTLCGRTYTLSEDLEVQGSLQSLWVPNAFTPNGDGVNENLVIQGDACWEDLELYIFNRWGEEVFHTQDPLVEFWNGKTQGETAQQGIYTLLFKTGDSRWIKTVALIQ